MSWLRSIFGSRPEPPSTSRHLGVLVRGTLWHAESAVCQLEMQGVEGMTGVASVFGMPSGLGYCLEAQTAEGRWVALSTLRGRWILIIPEDAYARYQSQFERTIGGRPLDGRVKPSGAIGGFELLNVSQEAVDCLCALIAQMPPLSPEEAPSTQTQASPPKERVTVGTCTACGRNLRVKAHAVRPILHLTCKCGAKNVVTVASEQAPKSASNDGA